MILSLDFRLAYHFHKDNDVAISEWDLWKYVFPHIRGHVIQVPINPEWVFVGPGPGQKQFDEGPSPEFLVLSTSWPGQVCNGVSLFATMVFLLGNADNVTSHAARHAGCATITIHCGSTFVAS